MPQHTWNTTLYEESHAFVWQYGKALVTLLNPQPGERILDLGCGMGQLTQEIAIAHASVLGMDADAAMIKQAKRNYPHLQFVVADAKNFQIEDPVDAIFSNAVLHWIKPPEDAIQCIYEALKPGGRLVAELGGKGNIKAIADALYLALKTLGVDQPEALNPWYFPSIGEYTTLLEQAGFEVNYAALFDRPTPLEDGDAGMANWLTMFAAPFLSTLPIEKQSQAIHLVEEHLRDRFYQDDHWNAHYRRLRIVAIKP